MQRPKRKGGVKLTPPTRQMPGVTTLKRTRVIQKPVVKDQNAFKTTAGKMALNQIPTERNKATMQGKLFTPPNLKDIRQANLDAQSVAGFRYQLNGSSSQDFTITLPSSGKQLLGIALTTSATTNLSDTAVNLKVNNRDLLNRIGANLINPQYTQGLLYYPVPQELTGKDNFVINFNKQDAGSAIVYVNLIYIPQL
jgi:hypothetical protein